MANSTTTSGNTQIGFHYFQDTLHYSVQDLETWLPELNHLSASWVVLLSDSARAIPEQFITGLVHAGINPIIHFTLQLPDSPSSGEIKTILNAYYRWGVRYVVFFDKPNDALSWSSAGWSHQDLVERFIDRFVPLAQEAIRIGLTPVFPPLMPGGSYWDTSFFKSSLQSLQRRGQQAIMEKMAAGVYAYTFGHELSWGDGGPEKWKGAKPYFTSGDSQDQRGFNIHQWIKSIATSFGLTDLQIIQFGAGIKQPGSYYSPEVHAEIVQSMLGKISDQESSSILSCNLWLLAADPASEDYSQTWIKSDSDVLPIVRVLSTVTKSANYSSPVMSKPNIYPPAQSETKITETTVFSSGDAHPINHYLLLPVYEWGVADWHLDVARPFILKFQPTVGFSLEEAALAQRVTVIGGDKSFTEAEINQLRESGCVVDQITGDGTSIATQLLER